jgi:serpin B
MNASGLSLGLIACLVLAYALVARAEAPLPQPGDAGGEVGIVVQGANAFAVDLYRQLAANQKGNLFCSPASVDTALAMTYAGAAGLTATQMAATLHYDLEPAKLHRAFAGLIAALNTPAADFSGKPAYQLTLVNALWGQEGYPFAPAFTALVQKSYGAALNPVDFAGHAEQARQTINAWVARKTADKIQDLIGPGALDPQTTRLVLTNAVYFKSNWLTRFPKEATADGPFTTAAGATVSVPMMRLAESKFFGYAENDGLQIVELPYESDALSMLILLPRKSDGLAALEQKLTAANLAAWTGRLEQALVHVTLPRFKFAGQFELSQTLGALGMKDAFADRADFSGMTGAEKLHISAVIHKAFVAVDEDGTEAAAATAIAMAAMALPVGEPKNFVADHPFLFLIRHRATGCVLFLGRVENPAAPQP